ncbi:MAG: TraB/GumN family protein [Leptothrix sp. (in: Bacteria)]|nr:TraB/GumN family protein [Leptothrix sp. (in: b-proteobacteria)]
MAGLFKTMCVALCAWVALGALAAPASAAAAAPSCPPPLSQQASTAGTAERDRGLLWRATRDGRTSWLYGTLHVGKPAWRRFGPQLGAALRASDVLALEIDPSDPALLAALAELQPAAMLPEALQHRLDQAYERACVSRDSMATLHPVLQATTLTLLEARWLGMDPTYAMEQLLVAQVRGNGRRVVSLETAAVQMAVLVPADPVEALSVVEQSLAQLEDKSARRVIERMAQAWERGDLAALEDYASWCECAATEEDRAFMRKLNDERNGPLADGIEAQHRQGRRVFAAVGALHMTGALSLPRLLAQRGFKVERVPLRR